MTQKKGKQLKKVLTWIGVAIVIIAIVTTVFVKGQNKGATYELLTPTMNDTITMSTILTGSIEPRDEVKVKPQMNGIVAELLHQPGDFVEVGELLARIQMVPDVGTVQNASARVDQARVRFQQLKEIYARDKELYEQQVLPLEQYQRSLAEYKNAEIDLASAEETLQLVTKGSSKRTAKQNNTMVRATAKGTILEQPVKVGANVIQANNFNEGTTIVSIADLTDLLFVGKVNETDINKVKAGADVIIRVGALPNETFPAVMEYVSPKGVNTNGTILFEVKAAIKGDNLEQIKAGFSSNAEIVLERALGVISVPESCISYNGGKTVVHISKNGGKSDADFEEREVTLGISDGLKVEVKSGLEGNEQLRGNRTLDK